MFINPLTERMRRARPCGDRSSQEYPKGDNRKVQQTVSASGQIQGPKGLRGSLFGVDKLQVFDWTEVGTARYVSGCPTRGDGPDALDSTLHLGTAGHGDDLRHPGPDLCHLADAI